MRWIAPIRGFLILIALLGLLGMPVGVVISFEPDGGTPADVLHQKKRLAQTVLLGSGATAIAAGCGLYIAGLTQRRGR